MQKKWLLINLDKKIIMEPGNFTLDGESNIDAIAKIQPKQGNPFQTEVFRLLMNDWKGNRLVLVEDSQGIRDYLIEQDGCSYYGSKGEKFRQEGYGWEQLINQYVLINYDSHLFMTIDQRLFKRAQNFMPYFVLAQAHNNTARESEGSWAGCRVGVEAIDTATFDEGVYFELFRLIGDNPAHLLGMADYERRFGKDGWKKS